MQKGAECQEYLNDGKSLYSFLSQTGFYVHFINLRIVFQHSIDFFRLESQFRGEILKIFLWTYRTSIENC